MNYEQLEERRKHWGWGYEAGRKAGLEQATVWGAAWATARRIKTRLRYWYKGLVDRAFERLLKDKSRDFRIQVAVFLYGGAQGRREVVQNLLQGRRG